MSKKHTRKNFTSWDIIKTVFYDLFHHESKKKLVDYRQLQLVDYSYLLGLVEWQNVNFIHWKSMRSLFEYVGAFSIFLFILSGFGFVAVQVNSPYTSNGGIAYYYNSKNNANSYHSFSDFQYYKKTNDTNSNLRGLSYAYDIHSDVDYINETNNFKPKGKSQNGYLIENDIDYINDSLVYEQKANDSNSFAYNNNMNELMGSRKNMQQDVDNQVNSYTIKNDVDYVNEVTEYTRQNEMQNSDVAYVDQFHGLVVVEKDRANINEYLSKVRSRVNSDVVYENDDQDVLGASTIRGVRELFNDGAVAGDSQLGNNKTCSFRVGDDYFSSGSSISVKDLQSSNYVVCASFDDSVSYNDWVLLNVEKASTPLLRGFSGTECYELTDYSRDFNGGDKIRIESYDKDANSVGSCVLNITD